MLTPTPVLTNTGALRVALPADPFMLVLELPPEGDWQAVAAVRRSNGERIVLPPCFAPADFILEEADRALDNRPVDLRA